MSQGNHTLFNSFDFIVLTGVAVATKKVAVERITLPNFVSQMYLQSSDSGIFAFGFIQLETQKLRTGELRIVVLFHQHAIIMKQFKL